MEPFAQSYFFAVVTRPASSWPAMVGKRAGFGDQLLGGSVVGRENAAERADFAEMAHQGARVYVSDHRNAVAFEIRLRGFAGTPVGSERREFADDQRFDVGLADSSSSRLVPTLPMWGYVRHTICPE